MIKAIRRPRLPPRILSSCLAAALALSAPGMQGYTALAQVVEVPGSGVAAGLSLGGAGQAAPLAEPAGDIQLSGRLQPSSGAPALISIPPAAASITRSAAVAVALPARKVSPLYNGRPARGPASGNSASVPTLLGRLSSFAQGLRRAKAPAEDIKFVYDGGWEGDDSQDEEASEEQDEEKPEEPKAAEPAKDAPKAAAEKSSVVEAVQALFRLRHDVQKDARNELKYHLGGDVGDGMLHKDVSRVLRRLLAAAGHPKEAAQVFIGNSFLPNAFSTIASSEGRYLKENASIAKAFRISNVFISLGLLRAMDSEAQLAFVLAHELMHNWKGHLKDFSGAGQAFLGHFHEMEADAEALKLLTAAGYDPREAIDSLYALDREYDRIEREYTLLKRDKGEVTQALQRLRDVHPHSDIRRASMLEHMNEALEAYRPALVPENPVWLRRRLAAERPSHLDRFQKRMERSTADPAIDKSIFNLETFIERERSNGGISIEGYAVIENAYKKLLNRPDSAEELRPIEVSVRREKAGIFPSPRLKSELITKQIALALSKIELPPTAPGALVLGGAGQKDVRVARGAAGRAGLDAAYQALAELPGGAMDLKNQKAFGTLQAMAVRLWRAARGVLALELGRAPLPEEIEEELLDHLPASPAWAKAVRLAAASEPVTAELNAVFAALGPKATLEDFHAAATGAGLKLRQAGLSWLLKAVSDRGSLEAATRALSKDGAAFGVMQGRGMGSGVTFDAGVRLWRAAGKVLARELSRQPTSKEIQSELAKGLPPAWQSVLEKVGAAEAKRPAPAATRPRAPSVLDDFLKASTKLSVEAKRAGALRVLGAIRDRRGLDSAYKTLSGDAEDLGLDLEQMLGASKRTLTQRVARRLWRAARGILTRELGRPALPEDIIDELRKKLSPSWRKSYGEGFNVEIIESAFGPAQYRSRRFRPSELAARLEGTGESFDKEAHWKEEFKFTGMDEWSGRHYNFPGIKIGAVGYQYERYRLAGLSSPSLEDQLDLLWFFGKDTVYPPFNRVLRQEGRMYAFLDAVLQSLGAQLKLRIKGAATLEERRKHMDWYEQKAGALLEASLYGVRDFKTIRETVAVVWEQIGFLLEAHEINAVCGESNRSHLASKFFGTMSYAFRQAVVSADMAGRRPDSEELRRTSELVRRIESSLRAFPSAELVKAHARNLLANLSDDRKYMKAYSQAVANVVILPVLTRFEQWLNKRRPWYLAPLFRPLRLARAVFLWAQKKLGAGRVKPLPGVPAEAMRSLKAEDFVHFLALIGDPETDAQTKLMAVALLDRVDAGNHEHGQDRFGRNIRMRAAASAGRWLLEDAARSPMGPNELRKLAGSMLRVSDLHPGLLQPDFEAVGTLDNAFRTGAEFIKRNEAYRSLAKGEHPFRGVNTRWALELAERLDKFAAWPERYADKLDLLDFLNSNGEFDDSLDLRVLERARSDPKAFQAWIKEDSRKLGRLGGSTSYGTVQTPFGQLPVPKAYPLRIVRNPALRVQLFDLLPEAAFKETLPRRSFREWFDGRRRLLKAYRAAREYFSKGFLDGLKGEGTMEDKIFDVLEEVDRVAAERAAEARKRWDKGHFDRYDHGFLKGCGLNHPETEWPPLLAHMKEDIVKGYKQHLKGNAMAVLLELYGAYAGVQEPLLGMIVDNYPEPTRSRDELLERVIKARRLSGGSLSYLESHKSYRQPNPVRIAEKHLLDQAVIQLGKFSPAEKVDILLHLAKIERLSKEKLSLFNRRILSGDRRKLASDYAALKSVAQLENYMSLMHNKDRALLTRALFYGEHSLHRSPADVRRLYEKLVIENRGLPPFMEKLFRAYFDIMNDDEKTRLISDLAALNDVSSGVKGPQIVRVALKGAGVTGAKIAQVLATHKGLIPEEYARELEGFKENAQELGKMRSYELIQGRMAKLDRPGVAGRRGRLQERLGAALKRLAAWLGWRGERAPPSSGFSLEKLDAISREALPEANTERKVGGAARGRLIRQVRFLLKEQGRKVKWIVAMGPELGAGSIKLVYKIGLDDGRLWVAKLRAPGAAYSTKREFELIDRLIGKLQEQGALDLPAAGQLLDEVKSLVQAEMNFVDEAAKESAMLRRIAARPWYVRGLAEAPYVPKPHPLYVGEDLMLEEFVPTTRFKDLPRRSLLGPSKAKIARLAVREGMFGLVFDEWLEPDPHTGNRHARRGGLYGLRTKLVLMDLGQGKRQPIELLKPMMKAALALDSGDEAGAAKTLLGIVKLAPKHDAGKILAALQAGLLLRPEAGIVERMMDGLLGAEKEGALVSPEYAPLQKAMLLYAGYSEYLPRNCILDELERATMARLLRDRPVSLWRLLGIWIKKTVLGRPAVRAELEALIDGLHGVPAVLS